MGLALGQPDTLTYALGALVVAALAFVPGLPLAAGLGRRASWRLPATLCAAFALQVGVVGLVALTAHYLGMSLGVVLVVSVVALGLAGIAALWPLGPWRPERGTPALALGAVGLALGVFERTWFARMADAFYHLAAVRSLLATGRPMVTDPMFGTPSRILDPTTGVWHTVLACWAKATGLDIAAWLWPGAVGVGAALLLMAFWELARTLSGSDAAATTGTLAWLVVGLAADVRWAEYPNRLSLAVAFVALAALASLAIEPRWPDAVLAVAATFGTAAMHMAAAEMLAAAGVVLLVLLAARSLAVAVRSRETLDLRPVAHVAGAGLVSGILALPLLLPKSALVRTSSLVGFQSELLAKGVVRLPLGMLLDSPGHLMKIAPPLFLLGTGIAVVAAVRAFGRGGHRDLVTAALAVTPAVLLADPPVTTRLLKASYYLTERVAILLPFTVFLGVAWLVAQPRRRGARTAVAALVATALMASIAFWAVSRPPSWSPGRDSVFSSRRDDVRVHWGSDTVRQLSALFGDRYPVVASDPETSYYLSGILPVAVVGVTSKHTPFAVEAADGQRRRNDLYALMSPMTAEAERREILGRRAADYVVVPKTPALRATLTALRREGSLLALAVETPSMAVFRVIR